MHPYMFVSKLSFIFCPITVVGIVLFVFWAVKSLKGPQLKKLSIWLVAIGIVGAVVSGGCSKRFGHKGKAMQGHQMQVQEVLGEHGVEFSEEEWADIHEEVKAKMKESWSKKKY